MALIFHPGHNEIDKDDWWHAGACSSASCQKNYISHEVRGLGETTIFSQFFCWQIDLWKASKVVVWYSNSPRNAISTNANSTSVTFQLVLTKFH